MTRVHAESDLYAECAQGPRVPVITFIRLHIPYIESTRYILVVLDPEVCIFEEIQPAAGEGVGLRGRFSSRAPPSLNYPHSSSCSLLINTYRHEYVKN